MVGPATIVWAALLGFSDAAALILGLTLPPLLCRPDDIARTSAGMFTISYGGAVVVAVISGVIWDLSGIPRAGVRAHRHVRCRHDHHCTRLRSQRRAEIGPRQRLRPDHSGTCPDTSVPAARGKRR